MAAVQVKHAENKQLQNKNPTAKEGERERKKTQRKSQEIRRENVAKFSQSSLCGIIFNIYCTIIEDDSSCLMVKQSVKTLLLHIQVSSHSRCGIDFNHSGSIRDTVYQNCVCVRDRGREKPCVSVYLQAKNSEVVK